MMKTLLQLFLNDDGSLSFFTDVQEPFSRELSVQVFHYLKALMPELRHRTLPYAGPHPELAEALIRWRRDLAREANIPPFYILHQRVLYAIADAAPQTEEELKLVDGFGDRMYEKYGKVILDICNPK